MKKGIRRAASPLTWSGPSPTAWVGLRLATRTDPSGPGRAFLDRERVLEALARGVVRIDDTIRVRGCAAPTTVGRFLASQCLPASMRPRFANGPLEPNRMHRVLGLIARELHVEISARVAEALETLGRAIAGQSGQSLAMGDFTPPARMEIVADGHAAVADAKRLYEEGLITDGERYNKTIDAWAWTADRIRFASSEGVPKGSALYVLGASSVESAKIRATHGLLAMRSGEVAERPVQRSLGDGLEPHDVMMTAMAARAEKLASLERRTVAAGLFGDLHVVLGSVRIVSRDCGTRLGVRVGRAPSERECYEDGAESFLRRIEGRVSAEEIVDARGEVLAKAGALLTRRIAERIAAAGVSSVAIRQLRSCEAEGGVCAACFGLDPDDALWTCPGDEVGARAAESIARAALDFAARFFHVC